MESGVTQVVHPLVKKRASSSSTSIDASRSAELAEYLLSGAYKADCVAVLPGSEGKVEELKFDD